MCVDVATKTILKVIMADEAICKVCQQPAKQKCSGCHAVHYCSKDHQKEDWKIHKKQCKSFMISEDPILGRYLVAIRDIKWGDVILKEAPLVWGPSQVTTPVCLGCGTGLSEKKNKPCQKCGWPMCSDICANSPSHIPECSFTVNKGDKVSIKVFDIANPTYQCITTLRCLYNKQFLPEVWKKIDRLQSHCAERRKTERYENDKLYVAAFIRRFFKLENYTEEEILRICGIITVNGHEVPLTEPNHVAVYETTSMFEHNCRANCSKTFTAEGHILITAGMPIKKGDHLSICYTDPLWGTSNRRHHLHETKFFWCHCERCQDPTEMETYFSCMKCQNGKCKGMVYPKTFIDNSNENSSQSWFCNICQKETNADEVHKILDKYGRELEGMQKGNSQACKAYIKNCTKVLSPNHYYITDVKFALSQLLGQEYVGGLPSISDLDLDFKVQICKQVALLTTKLIPAENRIRGLLLFELHAAIAEIGRRKGVSGETGPDYLYASLSESRKMLVEAIEVLRHEPAEMPEGKICIQARRNVKDIDVLLKTVHNAVGSTPV